jgi:hypothetical protein
MNLIYINIIIFFLISVIVPKENLNKIIPVIHVHPIAKIVRNKWIIVLHVTQVEI